jgi:hypothetical protein
MADHAHHRSADDLQVYRATCTPDRRHRMAPARPLVKSRFNPIDWTTAGPSLDSSLPDNAPGEQHGRAQARTQGQLDCSEPEPLAPMPVIPARTLRLTPTIRSGSDFSQQGGNAGHATIVAQFLGDGANYVVWRAVF